MNTADASTARRDRSYRVQRETPVGSRVRFAESAVYYEPIPAGTTGTIQHYNNAGFAGITASVLLDDGRLVHGIGAGRLEAV